MFDSIKLICQSLTKCHQFIEFVVDCIPKLVKILKTHPTTFEDLFVMVITFITLSKKKKYGVKMIVKIITSVKSVAKVLY